MSLHATRPGVATTTTNARGSRGSAAGQRGPNATSVAGQARSVSKSTASQRQMTVAA